MAAGDLKLVYPASGNQTVTNLNSLASSQSWVAGWESNLIDNSSLGYTDYAITAKLTAASANNQAGELRMYVAIMLDDSTWMDVLDGTESAETFTDTEMRDAICFQIASTVVDTGAGDVYYLSCPSLFAKLGTIPAKFVIFITGNATTTTTAQLAASGNQVTVKGSYNNLAA